MKITAVRSCSIVGFFIGGAALVEALLTEIQVIDLQAGEIVQPASNEAAKQDSYPAFAGRHSQAALGT